MISTRNRLARFLFLLGVTALSGELAVACSSDDSNGSPQLPPGNIDLPGTGGQGQGLGGEGGDAPVHIGDSVCTTNEDCSGEKRVCDPVQGCVACLFDWDCPAAHRCEANECYAKQLCTKSTDCKSDGDRKLCDEVLGECVECREDKSCGSGKRCERGECVAFTTCTNSRDCKDGLVCDDAKGACVTCVVDGDCGEGSACVDNTCLPKCDSDKDCLAVSMLCDIEHGRCTECLKDADCPAIYHCAEGGRCELDACEQGQSRCENDSTLGTCDLTGRGFENSTCAANTTCTESGMTASCVPWACTPNAVECSADGKAIVTCNADGSDVQSKVDCPENTACTGGECKPIVCDANENFCESNALKKCNAAGTGASTLDVCYPQEGSTCDASLNTCKQIEYVCYAYEPMCDGKVATSCKVDGSGPEAGGVDCSLTGATCINGSCAPIVCSDPYKCVDGSLYKCTNSGTTLSYQANCGSQGLCDAAGGKCNVPVCTPGAFVCNGNTATRCKADGSGYEANGQDCAASGLVCDGGGCLPKVCEGSSVFCQGGSPQKCSSAGSTYAPADTCLSNEYCQEGQSFCQADKCTAGAAVCQGNLATTCASDGSGPSAGGTDCGASGKVCDAGTCKDVTCTPGSKTCQGDAVYTCNASGTGLTLSQTCSASTFCQVSGSTAACVTDICTAASTGCNAEVVSTCASNGGGWINPGTNCASTQSVCIAGGACASSEVTTQGGTAYADYYTDYGFLTGFSVLSPRKLTELKVYAKVAGLQKFTWVVYEKRATTTTFDLVYQKVTAQTMPVAGFVSSGALDFTFAKNKSYAVGVVISGEALIYYAYSAAGPATGFTTANTAYYLSAYGQSGAPATATFYSDTYRPYLQMTTGLAN